MMLGIRVELYSPHITMTNVGKTTWEGCSQKTGQDGEADPSDNNIWSGFDFFNIIWSVFLKQLW